MTDREKIKAEIERKIAFQKKCIKNSCRLTGRPEEEIILEYEKLLSFINSLPEEPVREELEKAAVEWFNSVKYKSDLSGTPIEGFKAGAQWQKEVFEKNRLAACDRATKEEIEREQDFVDKVLIGEQRQPTFSDAIEYGIKWQKQQSIDKACNAFNKIFQGEFAQDIIDRYIKDFCKTLEEGCL